MQEITCTGIGKGLPARSKRKQIDIRTANKDMRERNYRKEITQLTPKPRICFTLNSEIDLNQNFRNKYKFVHTTQLQREISILNNEITRVNELGWLGPSQPARFPFKKRKDSTIKYASKIN